jgi:thiamine-phosphate pyrophosphorylase
VALALPKIIVITDWDLPREELLARLEAALSVGPQVAVQHRHPSAPMHLFFEEGLAIAKLCEKERNPLFVNGHLDVALLLGAHLHLPATSYSPQDARPHLPAGRWISAAVHNSQEAARAAGADLALISPVFAPGSKVTDDRIPLGPSGFRELASSIGCPAFALGGITAERAVELKGAQGFAVISAVLRADDSRRATREILEQLG